MSISLNNRFREWVRKLVIPTLVGLVVSALKLPITSNYLNFNYTSSLTEIYFIPRNNILYIHGEAREDDELVLGHAWNPVDTPSLNDVADPESKKQGQKKTGTATTILT